MNERWVVNASPLILLGKIGHLTLLPKLCAELVIPTGVAAEVRKGGADDVASLWLDVSARTNILDASVVPPLVTAWDLGAGESEVLAWALAHRNFVAILDDRVARRCAQVLQIPVRGTLGIIVLAKTQGHISSANPLLDALIAAGMRVSPEVRAEALMLAGE